MSHTENYSKHSIAKPLILSPSKNRKEVDVYGIIFMKYKRIDLSFWNASKMQIRAKLPSNVLHFHQVKNHFDEFCSANPWQ